MKKKRWYHRLFLGLGLGPLWVAVWQGKHQTFVFDWSLDFNAWKFSLFVFQRILNLNVVQFQFSIEMPVMTRSDRVQFEKVSLEVTHRQHIEWMDRRMMPRYRKYPE